MKMLLMLLMVVFFGFGSCDNRQWKMSISSPQNGATVSTASINLKGTLYLSSSLTEDNKILRSLTSEQRAELEKKVPPLSGNIYCNSKKATIDRTNRTWFLNGLALTQQGANRIFCYYQDSAGHTSQQTITVNYKPQANQPPIASFNCQSNEPLKLTCDASTSSDPDGEIVEYIFTSEGVEHKQTSPIISLTYSTGGSKNVDLRVKDNEGALSTKLTKQFNVTNSSSTSAQVGSSGGVISLSNIATISIPAGVFTSNTLVTLRTEQSLDIIERAIIDGGIYGSINAANFLFDIDTSNLPQDFITVEMAIPEKLKHMVSSNDEVLGVLLLEVSTNEELGEEIAVYRRIPIELLPNNKIRFQVDTNNFSSQAKRKAGYSSSMMISGFEGGGSPGPTYGKCIGVGFQKPFPVTRISGDYKEWRPKKERSHLATDIAIADNSPVKSPFNGKVIYRGVQCVRAPGKRSGSYIYKSSLTERNTECVVTGGVVQYVPGGYGEFLVVQDERKQSTLLYAHLNSSSPFKGRGSPITKNSIIANSGNTGFKIGELYHLHLEQISPFSDPLESGKYTFDPANCMLNVSLKEIGTITAFPLPTGVAPEISESCINNAIPADNYCKYKIKPSGDWNKYEWTSTGDLNKTECGPGASGKFNAGNHSITLKVTDYWGNEDTFKRNFTVKLGDNGDKEYYIRRPAQHRKIELVDFNSLLLDPTAVFTGSVRNTYPTTSNLLDVDATGSTPGSENGVTNGVLHTYRWLVDGAVASTTCYPKVKAAAVLSDGCHQVHLEVEDSAGKTASSTKQTFCTSSGDK